MYEVSKNTEGNTMN